MSVRTLVLPALALGAPVALVLGLLDGTQMEAQHGCPRTPRALPWIPALLGWFEFVRRRSVQPSARIEAGWRPAVSRALTRAA